MKTDNPYAPPTTESSVNDPGSTSPPSLTAIARGTFLAWEKLRLVYIGVLSAIVFLMASLNYSAGLSAQFRFFEKCIVGAVIANLCYFAGPVLETYVTWLGYRGRGLRIVLFVFGTLFSSILAFGLLAGELLPGMD